MPLLILAIVPFGRIGPFLLPEQYQKLKARAAQEAWEFISGLHKVFPQAEMLIISHIPIISEPVKANGWHQW